MEITQEDLESELSTLRKERDEARAAQAEAEALLAAARRELEEARKAKHTSEGEAEVVLSMDRQEELTTIQSQVKARLDLGEAQKGYTSLTSAAELGRTSATSAGSGATEASQVSAVQLGGTIRRHGRSHSDTTSGRVAECLFDEVRGENEMQLKQLMGKLPIALVDNRQDTMETFGANGTNYVIKALLGEGGFGSVYRCSPATENQWSKETAVKIINIAKLSMMTGCSQSSLLVRMLQEVQILQCLGRHEHIVQMHWAGVSKDPLCVFISMELMPFGDLFNELVRRRKPFTEGEARQVASQLTDAVRHCHLHEVAHRDIKLENIMLASRDPLWIKLCDYGQAKLLEDVRSQVKDTTAKTLTTNQLYTPPEVQRAVENNAAYDAFKVDAFGVGVVLYGILCSALPDAAKGQNYEKNGNWLQLSAAGQDLVRQLLNPDPSQRLAVEMVHLHPWSVRCPSPVQPPAPSVYESELQVLLAAHTLNKALQTERGASCWMLASACGVPEHRWRCKLTTSLLDDAEDKAITMRGACWVALRETLCNIRNETEILRGFCQDAAMRRDSALGADNFDAVFRRYSEVIQALIVTLGDIMMTLRGHSPCGRSEVRHCLLLIIAEQLGRERAFISGHMSQTRGLHSLPVRLRFAKIQGSRQVLLGSCSPSCHYEVVSASSGLMRALQLAEDSPLNEEEMRALEEAETQVMEGKTGTHEWFALLTKLHDKVHAHISVGLVEFFDQASLGPSRNHSNDHSQRLDAVDDSDSEDECGALPSMPMKVDPHLLLDTPEVTPIHYLLRKPSPNILSTPRSEITQWATPPLEEPHAAPGIRLQDVPAGNPSCTGGASPQDFPPPPQEHVGNPLSSRKERRSKQQEVVMSAGTVGHPHSCRKLGCKFASRAGCKEGASCLRCHLCLWTRAAERKIRST